jgi:hypothetical protein
VVDSQLDPLFDLQRGAISISARCISSSSNIHPAATFTPSSMNGSDGQSALILVSAQSLHFVFLRMLCAGLIPLTVHSATRADLIHAHSLTCSLQSLSWSLRFRTSRTSWYIQTEPRFHESQSMRLLSPL